MSVEDLKFISDPMLFGRHIVELNSTNNTLVRSYVWGLDLSGTMDGAGGVGGLLWVTLHTASGPAAGAHFAAYDGNGNVVALVSATTGTETARYEYGPFGEPIRLTGPAANQNPFRFSTKRTCNATDLVLYEYRAYNPIIGRWLSRDPIGEEGAINLYVFVANGSTYRVDRHGLDFIDTVSSWAASAASSFVTFLTSVADSIKSSVSSEFMEELTSIGKQYLSKGNGTWTVQYPRKTKDYSGGTLQFFWGAMYRVRVEGCCVRVEGGGFAGGRVKGPRFAWLGGARLVGGATLNVTGGLTWCYAQSPDISGSGGLTINGGLRWEADFVVWGTGFRAFIEGGLAGSWSWDIPSLKYTGWSAGVYVRGVAEFLVAHEVRRRHEFRYTWGDMGHIGD